jgi:CheY-like chemotaxis protein
VLANAGYRVVLAAGGQEALARLQQPEGGPFRLVLLDVTMPDLDGVDTFREIHRLYPDLPVLLMSGYNELEVAQRFQGGGPSGFIAKPFEGAGLLARVREVLNPPS